MGPGAATENKHHHICAEVLFETGHYSIGSCRVCGRYLFISGDGDKTTCQVASERESVLIADVICAQAQLAKLEAKT